MNTVLGIGAHNKGQKHIDLQETTACSTARFLEVMIHVYYMLLQFAFPSAYRTIFS